MGEPYETSQLWNTDTAGLWRQSLFRKWRIHLRTLHNSTTGANIMNDLDPRSQQEIESTGLSATRRKRHAEDDFQNHVCSRLGGFGYGDFLFLV